MNLFENLQLMKESVPKTLKERAFLSRTEYNKLKIALNKNNPMKGNFILHPGRLEQDNYKLMISVYGAFKNYEQQNMSRFDKTPASNRSQNGLGMELYRIYVNLIDNSIKFSSDYFSSYSAENYIRRYINTLVDKGELNNKDEINAKHLLDSIREAAEKSKEDVEKLLTSKNFIYNLSGKAKHGEDGDYNLDLNESKTLTEDFDPSMPNWLKVAIRDLNSSRNSNHKDYSFNYPLDTLKWTVEPFPEKGKLGDIENNEIIALLIDTTGDRHEGFYKVYCPALSIGYDETITINARDRKISNMSLRALAPYVKEFAHAINSSKNRQDVRDKMQDRQDSRKDSIERLDVKDYWRHTYDKLDKSGYVVDPNKYKRLLAKNNADKYAQQLEDLYAVLNDCKSKLNNYISTNMPDPKEGGYTAKYSIIKKAIDRYSWACGEYKSAMEELSVIQSGEKSYWGEGFSRFKDDVHKCNLKVVELLDAIDEVEKK